MAPTGGAAAVPEDLPGGGRPPSRYLSDGRDHPVAQVASARFMMRMPNRLSRNGSAPNSATDR